jgi:hypothetical protein
MATCDYFENGNASDANPKSASRNSSFETAIQNLLKRHGDEGKKMDTVEIEIWGTSEQAGRANSL